MKKIAVIVGHNSRSQGAHSIQPINRSEFDFNSELAEIMIKKSTSFDFDLKIFNRQHRGSYPTEIKEVYRKVDDWNADYSIELHFNSAVFTVTGSEVLTSGSSRSIHFATLVQNEFVKFFGRKGSSNRGVKVRKKGSRGYLSLVSGKAPAIIVEPFFGSSRYDTKLMHDLGIEKLAVVYLSAINSL